MNQVPHVTIEPVTASNSAAVIDLAVEEFQSEFVPDVASSLELAAQYADARPVALKERGAVIGFALYGIDKFTGNWKIFRLLIDRNCQGRGLGKSALEQIVCEMRYIHRATDILVCYHPENQVARELYRRFGFLEYGLEDNKILAKLPKDPKM